MSLHCLSQGCLFLFFYKNPLITVAACGFRTSCNCYFHTSQDGWTSLLLVESAMNPLCALHQTFKLSHNDIKTDLWTSKDLLVLVLGQEINSLILFCEAAVSNRVYILSVLFLLHFHTILHTHTHTSALHCLTITFVPQIFPTN